MERDQDKAENIIDENVRLSKYKGNFIVCESDDTYKDYSSTKVRSLLLSGIDSEVEKAKELVPKTVWRVLKA